MWAWIQTFDELLIDKIYQLTSSPAGDFFFSRITHLGDGGLFWILLAVILLCRKSSRTIGFQMLLSLALGYLLGNLFLKNIIARPRPFQVDPSISILIPAPREFSFPSGHALSSFESALVIRHHNKAWGRVALVLAAVIAFSRIYLRVHYPTDILGGLALAFFTSRLAIRISEHIEKNKRAKT